MKILVVLLFATMLGAQTKHCPDVPEKIPHSAVQPVYHGSGDVKDPYCPRDEYELKWYVSEKTEWTIDGYGGGSVSYYNGNGNISAVKTKILVFEPYCVPKEKE